MNNDVMQVIRPHTQLVFSNHVLSGFISKTNDQNTIRRQQQQLNSFNSIFEASIHICNLFMIYVSDKSIVIALFIWLTKATKQVSISTMVDNTTIKMVTISKYRIYDMKVILKKSLTLNLS